MLSHLILLPFSVKDGKTLWRENSNHKGDAVIGSDVWVGHRAVTMRGITIGDRAIISAYAVITKDVAPYAIVGCNPATVIRKRFEEKFIEQLLNIRWWHWNIGKVTRHVPDQTPGNVEAFLESV